MFIYYYGVLFASVVKVLLFCRQQLYGFNVISVEVRSYLSLLLTEVLNPFYVFQVASIMLWSFDNYYLYASCIFFISMLSIVISLYETRKVSKLHSCCSLHLLNLIQYILLALFTFITTWFSLCSQFFVFLW